jgi:hypothetical protein
MIKRCACLGICLGFLAGFAACRHGERTVSDDRLAESIDALSAEVGLKFSPSTHLLGVHRMTRGIDDAIQAKVELPMAELPALLSQTQIDAESFEPGTGGLLGPDDEFWDPHKASSIRTGQGKRPDGRVINVGIDEGKPGVAVVYIMVHET